MQPIEGPLFLTLRHASRRLGIGQRQLERARDRGELPVYVIGGWSRVNVDEVRAWLERCRHPTAAPEAEQ
jgi:excisionase family DNA binding protein